MNGLTTIASEARDVDMDEIDIERFLNLFLLLYADDTVIFSESVTGLQDGLNLIKQYCDRWRLDLNIKKCKVVIFSRGKVRKMPHFFLGNEELEVVSDFLYLGLKLNYNNRMHVAQKDLCDRASRAMFSLMKKYNDLSLPVDLMLDLFDKTVLPVLTYGCEIWGHDVLDIVTKIQLKFYKCILSLRQSTPSMMVFGETGKYPVTVSIKTRMLCFWFKLCVSQYSNKLSCLVYKCLLKLYLSEKHKNHFLQVLNNLGLSIFWANQTHIDVDFVWFKGKIKQCLKDQFLHQWYTHIDNDDMYINYRMYKPKFGQDAYFTLLPQNCMITILKFLTTNNPLPVNKLRYNNIVRTDRICTKCDLNNVGDEFHYIFVCPAFVDDRKKYLSAYLCHYPNAAKFYSLFASNKKIQLLKLKHFVHIIIKELR